VDLRDARGGAFEAATQTGGVLARARHHTAPNFSNFDNVSVFKEGGRKYGRQAPLPLLHFLDPTGRGSKSDTMMLSLSLILAFSAIAYSSPCAERYQPTAKGTAEPYLCITQI
jgi:hypothetical protein